MEQKDMAFLNQFLDDLLAHNTIPSDLYEKVDVKRGLRHADGSGVISGLTRISSVIGAKKEDEKWVPCQGELNYRGIALQTLCDSVTQGGFAFEKTLFLLLIGRLPDENEARQFAFEMAQNRAVPREIIEHGIHALPSRNIMNKLQTIVSLLYTDDPSPEGLDPLENLKKSIRLIAKLPMSVAYGYLSAYKETPKYVEPEEHMSMAESFLYMLREGERVDPLDRDILDLCLVLHAEHGGGNNSSFTTYVVTSSGSDIYGSITAALGSLKGPLHGAANKKVMDMMADIKGNVSNWGNEDEIYEYLCKIVKKEAHDGSGKIYGLGHAVYTKSDPRAEVLLGQAKVLAESKGRLDELNLYLAVAKIGPRVFQDIKKSEKVIAPNVDFFSGFVYDCLGIPQDVYTPMFAMARSAGWCAHRVEEILSGRRVIRPTYKYMD